MLHESLSGVKPFAAGSVDIIDILSAIKKDEPADLRDITDLGAVDDGVAELILRGCCLDGVVLPFLDTA